MCPQRDNIHINEPKTTTIAHEYDELQSYQPQTTPHHPPQLALEVMQKNHQGEKPLTTKHEILGRHKQSAHASTNDKLFVMICNIYPYMCVHKQYAHDDGTEHHRATISTYVLQYSGIIYVPT